MTTDDDKRRESGEDQSLDVTAEELEDGELEDGDVENVAGGMRMRPVASIRDKGSLFGGATVVRPRGATVTINGLTADRDVKGR